MHICPNCSNRNRPGVLFCESCGASLIGDSPMSTRNLSAKSPNGEYDVAEVLDAIGSDIFEHGTVLRIEVEGAEPLLLKPKEETVFGRRDPSTGSMPDVDMTPFAGYRMGVSRKHATIKQLTNPDRLELWDLGSSNGTFLNGARLGSEKGYRLRDGDEVRLGQIVMKVTFQHPVSHDAEVPAKSVTAPMPSDKPAAPPTADSANGANSTISIPRPDLPESPLPPVPPAPMNPPDESSTQASAPPPVVKPQ